MAGGGVRSCGVGCSREGEGARDDGDYAGFQKMAGGGVGSLRVK
jgi:hypothetical protein